MVLSIIPQQPLCRGAIYTLTFLWPSLTVLSHAQVHADIKAGASLMLTFDAVPEGFKDGRLRSCKLHALPGMTHCTAFKTEGQGLCMQTEPGTPHLVASSSHTRLDLSVHLDL